jgi:hypothetical protein
MEKQRGCLGAFFSRLLGPFLRRVPDATRGERIVAAMQQATAAPGGRTHDVAGCVLMETTDGRIFRGPRRLVRTGAAGLLLAGAVAVLNRR